MGLKDELEALVDRILSVREGEVAVHQVGLHIQAEAGVLLARGVKVFFSRRCEEELKQVFVTQVPITDTTEATNKWLHNICFSCGQPRSIHIDGSHPVRCVFQSQPSDT